MKWIGTIKGIEYLYFVNKNISIQKKELLESLDGKTSINIKLSNSFYWRNYFYQMLESGVNIFDGDLKLVFQYDLENVSGVIDIFEKDSFVLSAKEEGNNFYYFINTGEIIKKQPRFFGKILNELYRLNFPEGTFNNSRHFRCSDLLNEVTYWEYDCGEGYVADRFYVWKDNLVFVKGGGKGSILLVIELRSGRVIWEKNILHGAFNIDEERGLLVSMWGNVYVENNFQIIDLAKQAVISEKIHTEFNFENVNVHWQQQCFYKNKLYFTDNVHSHGDNLRPIKFGCFDIETKKVDFLQEVPEAAGGQFAQVIYHNNKLYLRTSGNELFIFEDENVAF